MGAKWITEDGNWTVEVVSAGSPDQSVTVAQWSGEQWAYQASIYPTPGLSASEVGDELIRELSKFLDPASLVEITSDPEGINWDLVREWSL